MTEIERAYYLVFFSSMLRSEGKDASIIEAEVFRIMQDEFVQDEEAFRQKVMTALDRTRDLALEETKELEE